MNIYPAIDLINGQCVRLHQGNYDEMTAYANDPVKMAQEFAKHGAKYLHVVDLDGAKQQSPQHFEIIERITKETTLQVQTGGGIRTAEQIRAYLQAGVQRIILGSIAVAQIEQVKKWFNEFGAERLVLALDIRMQEDGTPLLATHGWQENSNVSLWDLIDMYQEVELQHVLCTDIARDGTLQGPNFVLYRECTQRYPHIQFQASGGIKGLEDIQQLAEIPMAAAIVGKALYEGRVRLEELLVC
ncbi:MAG: 1-(5-phosphoribosyl)-5-[(5-phosphoribosylamino)methylideneamino]imidazole-4-carboxamide isomerase [Gammaproteobacteria bacterium]